MSMANRFMWQKFNLPISIIVSESKLTKNEFYKSRNKLKQFGLIEFKKLGGNRATVYKVNLIVSLYGKQIGTQMVTQNVNILKTKNQKLKRKRLPPTRTMNFPTLFSAMMNLKNCRKGSAGKRLLAT